MKEYFKYSYFKPMEEIVDILCVRTGASDRSFFRNLVNFYFGQVASNMRCSTVSKDRGILPVNYYSISLATSGLGKGYSSNIIVDEVINGFREEFMESTYPFIANYWLEKIAKKIANFKSTEFDEEMEKVQKQFDDLGSLLFSFDSGTLAGMKQLRQKMLMCKIGSLSFIADEIGSNLTDPHIMDIIKGFLELYDVGKIGDKLLKNSKDSARLKQIYGRTPANMILFGTPSKLFDGTQVENIFRSLLTTGLARRCFFAYSVKNKREFKRTDEEVYDDMTNNKDSKLLEDISDYLKDLADSVNYNSKIKINKAQSVKLVSYHRKCQKLAQELSDNEEEKKAELEHSYFKVTKLAGIYAFIDKSDVVTDEHIYAAIRWGLDSTKVFQDKIISQDQPHVRLLKYLYNKQHPSTYADMARDLPFFPKAQAQRLELFKLAASEGYINNVSITHKEDNGIDLYSANKLEKTNLEAMFVSYSDKISRDYENSEIPFYSFYKLSQEDGYHWCNHHLEDGVRSEDNVIAGFNMVVLDLDKNVDIDTVKMVFNQFTYHLYTTKRHTDEVPRFRVVVPLSHIVELNKEAFSKFMNNVYAWLPFNCDEVTNQRSRKWLSCRGSYSNNEGTHLLDAHQFIPQTTKAVQLNKTNSNYTNVAQLEKWFIRKVTDGDGRNNTLIKYAFVLLDSGLSHIDIMGKVAELNNRFAYPITDARINASINVTIAKRIAERSD